MCSCIQKTMRQCCFEPLRRRVLEVHVLYFLFSEDSKKTDFIWPKQPLIVFKVRKVLFPSWFWWAFNRVFKIYLSKYFWVDVEHLRRSVHCCLVTVMSNSFPIPWTVVCQASLSMGFHRQENWSGLPFPSPGDLLDPGTESLSPVLQANYLPLSHLGSPMKVC